MKDTNDMADSKANGPVDGTDTSNAADASSLSAYANGSAHTLISAHPHAPTSPRPQADGSSNGSDAHGVVAAGGEQEDGGKSPTRESDDDVAIQTLRSLLTQ